LPRHTLLEMTQDILSALDGDEVNSVGDTVEALQVATTIKQCYYDICATLDIPSKMALMQLEPTNDTGRPNYLRLPDTIRDIEWLRYNKNTVFYMTPEEFVTRNVPKEYIEVTDFNGIIFQIGVSQDPKYWTTFDNEYVCFDSYNMDEDATLQSSKSLCWGQTDRLFEITDNFVPDLDATQFPLLMAEAIATCFVNQKQITNNKAEATARRQLVRGQNDRWRLGQRKPYNRTPDYGRRR
jgi:hypothetical protein